MHCSDCVYIRKAIYSMHSWSFSSLLFLEIITSLYFVPKNIITKSAYIPVVKNAMNLPKTRCLYSSQDPHQDIKVLLARYESNPDSEAHLKLLLPRIISSFGRNKSVTEIIKDLKLHQSSTDSNGMFIVRLFGYTEIYGYSHCYVC